MNDRGTRGSITVAGSLAQKPLHGGHSWVLLQYLLGFKRLGWEVLFVDALSTGMCFDQAGNPCDAEQSVNIQVFRRIMRQFGLQDDSCVVIDDGRQFIGAPRERVLDRVGDSDFLLNVMGYLSNAEILGRASRLVFLDIDPGFGQMWAHLGLADLFSRYDDLVTIGENIGQPRCRIPTCGRNWITTRQPIVLGHWPARFEDACRRISSVVSWRGAYGPIDFEGRIYGLRAHEFRKFVDLPAGTDLRFQLALDIHPSDSADRKSLHRHGWEIVDPARVAGDPWSYRSFIHGSSAEFMVAKNIYVDTRSGWFSDRSICYLASGKPVLAQDTDLQSLHPTGEGIVLFTTLQEAREAVRDISVNYSRHARAARRIAEEHFDSDIVLAGLLGKLGVA